MKKAVTKAVEKTGARKSKRPPEKAAAKPAKKKAAATPSARPTKAQKPKAAAKKQPAKPAGKSLTSSRTTAKKTDSGKKTPNKQAAQIKAKKGVKPTAERASSLAAKPGKAASAKATAKKAIPKKTAAGKTTAKKPTAKKPAPKKVAVKRSPAVKKTASTKRSPVRSAKRPVGKAVSKMLGKPEAEEVIKEFRKVVNLTPQELERRLSTPIAKKLGLRDAAQAGIVGHESGRRILAILTKSRRSYTDDDLRHMKIVVKYVRKRRREKPPGDIFASNWRFSLLNWGHDPMRSRRR